MGIPLFEVGKPIIKYEDVISSVNPVATKGPTDPEDFNRLTELKQATFFKFGTDPGLKLDYYVPKAYGMSQGITDSFMAPNEWSSLYLKYDTYRKKFERLGGKLQNLSDLASSGKLTGYEGLKGRIGDTIKGLGNLPLAQGIAKSLLGTDLMSKGTEFDINARLVLAEIAPFILGESGKTISDADRVRVAQSLGYVAKLENGVFKVEGFNDQLLKNPESVLAALREVSGVINKYIALGDSEMQTAMVRFGKISPEQTSSLLKGLDRDPLSEIRKKVKGRVKDSRNYRVTVPVDLDLTSKVN